MTPEPATDALEEMRHEVGLAERYFYAKQGASDRHHVGDLKRWIAAWEKERATNQRLNRRCQIAEAAISEKIGADLPSQRTFGRALANAAADKAMRELAALRAEVEALERELLGTGEMKRWEVAVRLRKARLGEEPVRGGQKDE